MSAKTGKPIAFGIDINTDSATWEIHEPAEGTRLAVCPECGFEFDASHTVHTGTEGASLDSAHVPVTVGYECPRCILRLLIEARQRVIEQSIDLGIRDVTRSLRIEMRRLHAVADFAARIVCPMLEQGRNLSTPMRWLASALMASGRLAVDDKPATPTPGSVVVAMRELRQYLDKVSPSLVSEGTPAHNSHIVLTELERIVDES